MERLLAASLRLPMWTRWSSWLVTAAIVFVASAWPHPAWIPLALAAAGFTAFANLPALAFDGPMPFSSRGLHVRGNLIDWSKVERIEPAPGRGDDLQAVLVGDPPVLILMRVRGARTRDDLRAALNEHAPGKVAF